MFWTDTRGSTSVVAAVSIVALAGVSAAALEMSRASAAATDLQDVADSLALSAARDLADGKGREVLKSQTEAAALALMEDHAPDATNATADVSFSPDRPRVTVRLSQKVGLFGEVEGVATAFAEAPAPICLLVLDPQAQGSWSVVGNASVRAPECSAQVNSAAKGAIRSTGAGKVETLRTLVVGPGIGKTMRGFTPAPAFGQPLLPDEFASALPWPAPAHCDHQNLQVRETVTLQPGVYCGGLSVSGKATVTLAPGVYVLKDGPLQIASHGHLKGPAGVTFVLIGRGGFVESRAGANLQLQAPTSGPWSGFAIAQAPNAQEHQSSVVIGGGDMDVDGMVYLPAQRMMISGAGEGFVAGVIVKQLDMRGNGRLRLAPGVHAPMLPGSVRLEEPPPPPPPA